MPGYMQYPFIVLFTTIVWLAVTFLTPAEDRVLLEGFVKSLDLSGAGWKKFGGKSESTYLSSGIKSMLLGCVLVYGLLFAVGKALYGETLSALILLAIAVAAGLVLRKNLKK
jgi:hypothetical protein